MKRILLHLLLLYTSYITYSQDCPNNSIIEGANSVCAQTRDFVKVEKSDPNNTLEWKINGFTIPNFSEDSLSLFVTSESRIEIIETNNLGCITTHIRNIIIHPQPNKFNIINNKSVLCHFDSVMYQIDPKDIDANTTYTWTYKGNVINTLKTDGNNADSVFVNFNAPVTSFADIELITSATNQYGCSTLSDSVSVKIDTVFNCQIVGKNKLVHNNNIKVSPNPFENATTISVDTPSSIVVYDVNGNIVEAFESVNEAIIGRNLTSGIYFVSIQNEKGVFHQKILKQ